MPFPLPWIGAAIVGGLLALPVGLVVLRQLRSDYQAIALLVTSVIANTVITNARPFLNGAAGLALVPPPLADQIDPNTAPYQYFYVGLTILAVVLVVFVVNRVVNSPYGRSLRAMRERETAAMAIGKDPVRLKMTAFIVGGVIAGFSGALLVGFIQFWAPSVWLYPETIILFAAIIVGGRGNNVGAILGALLVPVGGGGLISGIAAAVKGARPQARVIAVEPELSPALHEGLAAGNAVPVGATTIADGLNAPFAGDNCLAICKELVDEVVLVTEEEIKAGMRFLYERGKLACEPAGAAATGALLAGKVPVESGENVVAIVSGGNVTPENASAILGEK
jgi:branched-subunit amino acid ABC-type transport system permease component